MEATNPYGDLELTSAALMRALAHPVRLEIWDRLRRYGPATATELAPHVGATPSVTSWHLRHLAGFGLVRDAAPDTDRRARRWEAAARGVRLSVPANAGAETEAAARVLSRHFFDRAAEVTRTWNSTVEPGLDGAWRHVSGVSDTRVVVSNTEAAGIATAIEAVLAPFVTRPASARPEHARGVRMLWYVLPEAHDSNDSNNSNDSEALDVEPDVSR